MVLLYTLVRQTFLITRVCIQALDPKKYYIVTLALFANGEVRCHNEVRALLPLTQLSAVFLAI